MKFIGKTSIVILVIFIINWRADTTVELGGDGTQDAKLTYIDNPGSALMKVGFAAHISQALAVNQTVTAICISKQDNATDVQIGDTGFGVMFACYLQEGCSNNTRLSTWLFASNLTTVSPPAWTANGTNYSQWNIGSPNVGNGTDIDTVFIFNANNALSLTIPPPSQNSTWRCYFDFIGNETDTKLDK